MNYEQLKKFLLYFKTRLARLTFLIYWLEDINFHTECSKINGLLTSFERSKEDLLFALHFVANEAFFRKDFFDGQKDKLYEGLSYDQLKTMLDTLRQDKAVSFNFGEVEISPQAWREYTRAREAVAVLSTFTGWGVDNELTYNKMLKIIKECDQADKEREKTMYAYMRAYAD